MAVDQIGEGHTADEKVVGVTDGEVDRAPAMLPGTFSDKQTVFLARAFIVGIVVITFGLSLLPLPGVFDLATWCFSGFTSLVPLVTAAIYWKRLTKPSAYAAIIVTAVLGAYFFVDSGYGSNPQYTVLGMLPVASMFVCSTAAMIAVSLITKPPSDTTLAKFFPAATQP